MALINTEPEVNLMNRLLDLIEKGNYEVGSKLPTERELAKMLNTNRNTLRETLKVLQAMGIINIRHGSGIYMEKAKVDLKDSLTLWITLHKDDVDDLHVVRETLESKAIDLIPQDRSIIVADQLKKSIEKLDIESCTVQEFVNHDLEFHNIICSASCNNVLISVCQNLTKTIFDDRWVYGSFPERRKMSYSEHSTIAAAFATANRDFIKQVEMAHFISVKSYMSQLNR